MGTNHSDQNKSFEAPGLDERTVSGEQRNCGTRKKVMPAVQALLLWFVTTGTASVFTAAALIHQGSINPFILICVVGLAAVLLGYCIWIAYYKHNRMDGDSSDVHTS